MERVRTVVIYREQENNKHVFILLVVAMTYTYSYCILVYHCERWYSSVDHLGLYKLIVCKRDFIQVSEPT